MLTEGGGGWVTVVAPNEGLQFAMKEKKETAVKVKLQACADKSESTAIIHKDNFQGQQTNKLIKLQSYFKTKVCIFGAISCKILQFCFKTKNHT